MGELSSIEWTDHKSRRRSAQLRQAAHRTGLDLETWKLMREMGRNWCIDCKSWKLAGEFNKDNSRRFGLQQYCKCCAKIRGVACRLSITKDEARQLLSRNECEICLRSDVPFEVDHCHKTGKARGLLCSRCNSAIGLFLESPELMAAAMRYLERYKWDI